MKLRNMQYLKDKFIRKYTAIKPRGFIWRVIAHICGKPNKAERLRERLYQCMVVK